MTYKDETNRDLISKMIEWCTWNDEPCIVPPKAVTPPVRKYYTDLGYKFAIHRSGDYGVGMLVTVDASAALNGLMG